MPSGSPVRFPYGLTNALPSSPLAMFGLPDPSKWHVYFNDFNTYVAGDWTVTNVGTTPTQALTDVDGGNLLLTTTSANPSSTYLQLVGEGFLMAAGKRAVFKARLRASEVTTASLVMGLQVTDTTPLDVTDGIYFIKPTAQASFDFICRKNATTGSTSGAAVVPVVADTFIDIGWYYDGKASAFAFYYDTSVNRWVQPSTLDASSTYLPDTELTVSFGVLNGAGSAITSTIDYILAAKER